MLREDIKRLEEHQQQLREHLRRLDEPIVRLEGDEECQLVTGNEAAFVRLAIDCLQTASGRDAIFDPPLALNGSPISVVGMKYDPDLTPPVVQEQPWWGNIVLAAILGAITIVIMTGVIVDITWIEHQVTAIFRH